MSKKQTVRKNAGGGAGPLPLRRSYERALKQETKYPDPREIRPTDRTTSKDKEVLELTVKVKPEDYTIEQWRRATLINLSTSEEDRADRSKYLLPIRNAAGSLSFDLLAEAERQLFAGKPKEAPIEKRREAAARIIEITRPERTALSADEELGLSLMLTGADGYDFSLISEQELTPEHLNRMEVRLTEREAEEEAKKEVKLSEQAPSTAEVEAYMEEHKIEDYGMAARAVVAERGYRGKDTAGEEPIFVPEVDVNQENTDLRAAIQERKEIDEDYRRTVEAVRKGENWNGGYDVA